MPTPFNPFAEVERFLDLLSRQIEDTSRNLEAAGPLAGLPLAIDSSAVDVIDRDEELVVTADLPGFEREEVDVRVKDQRLWIEAEREERTDDEEMDGHFVRRERRHRATSRTVPLPDEVDPEDVEARMTNGVLRVTLPKVSTDRGRGVEIEVE